MRNSNLVLLLLIAIGILLGCATLVQAQSLEISWQPFPIAELGPVEQMKNGFVWTVDSPLNGNGPAIIQRVDDFGNILWEKQLSIWPNLIQLLDILAGPNEEVIISYYYIDCDVAGGSGLMILDSLGEFIGGYNLGKDNSSIYNLKSVSQESLFPILGGYGNKLVRLDSLSSDLVSIPLDQKGNLILEGPDKEFFLSLDGGGLAVIDPLTGAISDTSLTSFQYIKEIFFPSDTSRFLVTNDSIYHIYSSSNILNKKELNNFQYWGGFINQGYLYLINYSSGNPELIILDYQLDTISIVSRFTDDTQIGRLISGNNEPILLGQESNNVFFKSISPTGEWKLVSDDPAITDASWIDLKTSVEKFGYCHPQASFSGLKIQIKNNGSDTLDHVLVNWNEQVQFSIPVYWCQSFAHQLMLDNLDLAPGESNWIPLPDLTFFRDVPCDSTYQFDICFELSTPNDRIDANHSNDKFCVPIEVKTTSTADLKPDRQVLVYPDPFSNTLHLDNLPTTIGSVQLLDLFGRVVYTQSISAWPSFTIDVPTNHSGLYIIALIDDAGKIIETKRLLRAD